jgi:hypothetical protein
MEKSRFSEEQIIGVLNEEVRGRGDQIGERFRLGPRCAWTPTDEGT